MADNRGSKSSGTPSNSPCLLVDWALPLFRYNQFQVPANWILLDNHHSTAGITSTSLQRVYLASQLMTLQETIGILISKQAFKCLGPSPRNPGVLLVDISGPEERQHDLLHEIIPRSVS